MAWTNPATAVDNDLITAAFWNTNGRDNLAWLHDYMVRKLQQGGDHHIEGGSYNFGTLQSRALSGAWRAFAEAFSVSPYVLTTPTYARRWDGVNVAAQCPTAAVNIGTTGFEAQFNAADGAALGDCTLNWLAFGEG